jgi:hypothetical protein
MLPYKLCKKLKEARFPVGHSNGGFYVNKKVQKTWDTKDFKNVYYIPTLLELIEA